MTGWNWLSIATCGQLPGSLFFICLFLIGLFLLADCQEVLEGGRDPLQFLWRTSRLRPQHGGQQPDPVKGKKERSKDTFLARRKEEGG